MARIDSILSIVVQQNATELRLGTDREPRMLAHGTPKKLALPTTPDDMLRHLLGEILTDDRERALRGKGRLEVPYDAGPLGAFHVTMTTREGSPGIDVVMTKGMRAASQVAREAAPVAASAASNTPGIAAASAPASAPALVPVTAPAPAPPSARAPAPAFAFAASPAASPQVSPELASLLARAAESRASDVHIHDAQSPVFRVDGALRPIDDLAGADVDSLLGPCFDTRARDRIANGQSADIAAELEGVGRVRINVYRTSIGLAAAVRILARTPPPLASLHMPMALDELALLPHGLVIVCGPTGSGKSTTLAALAQEALRRRSAMLLTLEDPIEYELTATASSLVRQRQVGRDVKDFATGLRDGLREDPDVLLIGEMRDPETISLALTAAETGHLVLTSLHSRSTASAVERIVDVYPAERQNHIRVQLAESLRAVVAQRLLPRARGGGRLLAIEVLRVNHNVASVIREGKTAQIATALQSGKREGMLALERCLADLVTSGQVSLEEARAVANEPSSFAMYVGK